MLRVSPKFHPSIYYLYRLIHLGHGEALRSLLLFYFNLTLHFCILISKLLQLPIFLQLHFLLPFAFSFFFYIQVISLIFHFKNLDTCGVFLPRPLCG